MHISFLGKYPFINKAKSVLFSNEPFSTFASTIATVTMVTATLPTVSISSGGEITTPSGDKCFRGDGYYADRDSGCTQYYICRFTGTSFLQITYYTCPSGMHDANNE